MDTWRNISHPLKHQIELKMRGGRENISFLPLFLREREGEGEKSKNFFDDPQSPSRQELKSIASISAMRTYQK